MAPFLFISLKSSCGCSDLSLLSDILADLDLQFSVVLVRDVKAPIALASPIKIPGCGGFFSSVAPAKLPERGGSYSSTVAGFDSGSEFGSGLLDEISSEDNGSSPVERVMFERSLLLGICVELWRMRSRLRLILSEIRRTWEVGGRGEDGVEFMSSVVVEAEVMLRFAMECGRHLFLSWA
ncbi:hypothetical protein HID58_079391 [Brassica napus]|uniref:Uncharacterized protein n=1 Tax=Brassica napus TaxID=3708 RepID=A0ABQ7Y1V7_BRANA|nr:hypothetical protein HID58_079391 [Brassica napus]